jgi:predicted nucleotidyltransferase/uncharacterized protein YutE (UPF0331/DUF86 family)
MTDDPGAPLAERLTTVLSSNPEVVFALLFGSAASGRQTSESDVDVAVYFGHTDAALPGSREPSPDNQSAGRVLPDIEETTEFPAEHDLWRELERAADTDVDLVVLNRAAATIAASALATGTVLVNRDPSLYRKFELTVTSLAEEQREFADDFVKIKDRSRSLSDIDRARLIRIVDFLQDELEDYPEFRDIDLERYSTDRTMRRSVERWVENLVNASIDAAKIVLASERRPVPHTYAEALEMLATVKDFWPDGPDAGRETARRLAQNTRVRNMLAHEYLDLRFTKVDQVVDHAEERYGALVRAIRYWMG